MCTFVIVFVVVAHLCPLEEAGILHFPHPRTGLEDFQRSKPVLEVRNPAQEVKQAVLGHKTSKIKKVVSTHLKNT